MNTKGTSCITFKRVLDGGKVLVRTECTPGRITVLQDENGADLPGYEAFFYGRETKERISIELDQNPLDISQVLLIGFSDTIPPGISISDYLTNNGYQSEEIPNLLRDYELEKVAYLPCAHLPQVPQRIVQMLIALRSGYRAIIMKDPFMPFSGRWREHFAALMLKATKDQNQVIVCTNLSFVPQTWSQGDSMQYLDVGHAAEEARSRHRWELEKKDREQQIEKQVRKTEVAAAVSTDSGVTNITEKISEESPSGFPIPESLGALYKEAQDRIFTPLKEFSDFMRSYALLVGISGMVFLVVSMGVVFSPNLGEMQKKIILLSSKSTVSFSDILDVIRPTTPTAPTEQSIEELQADSIQTLEYPENEFDADPEEVDGNTPKEEWMIELDQTSVAALLFLLDHGDFSQNLCTQPSNPNEEPALKEITTY